MKRASFSSLRVRLIALVLLALAPAFWLILYTGLEHRWQVAAAMEETALRLARVAASHQGRMIVGTNQLLVGLAELPAIRAHDPRKCSLVLTDLLRRYPLYANLGAIKPSGERFCSAVPTTASTSVADRAYFQRAVRKSDFAIGDYQLGDVTGKPTVDFAYPAVDDQGQLLAVVYAALDLTWLNEFVADAKLPEGSTLTIIDARGTIVVRYPDPSHWVGKSLPQAHLGIILAQRNGSARAMSVDSLPRIIGFTPLFEDREAGDLFVNIEIPEHVALGRVNRSLARNVIMLGLVGILVFLTAWSGGHALVLRQVRALVAATRRLSAGDLSVRTGLPSRDGELHQLARAFDEMADTLQRQQREAREAEEQLRRQRDALYESGKLAALGRLAAGIAHELNNPITIIAGRIELLSMLVNQRAPSADTLRKHVLTLVEAAERIKQITKSLSTYSKPTRREPALLNLTELLAALPELVAHQARSGNVTVSVDAPPVLPAVLGDRSDVMQVLLNLTTNAIEAIGQTGGRVKLKARVEERSADGRTPGSGSTERVVVEVHDTGPGIPAEVLPRIWAPFYTTKPEGTGLGLSIVQSLVAAQPGATISVESRPQQGTAFILTMPVAETKRE